MKPGAKRFLLLATVLVVGSMSWSALCFGQPPWNGILDPSRAIDWSTTGFSIPSYSVNCATQPTLKTGSSNASVNTTAIQNALASCDSTHNVVNLPAGTYYVAGVTYGSQGHQVIRGAGASSTYIYTTAAAGCIGAFSGICMMSNPATYSGGGNVLPGGSQQCSWTGTNGTTGTYTKGATSIILNNCGGAPPVNKTLILDQANDSATDNGGDWFCDTYTSGGTCTQKGNINQNSAGRVIGGVDYAQQQVVYVTAVSGSGSGPYTVTISPGVYFNNVRSSQSPGAWWPGFVQNDGLENLTIDHSLDTSTTYGITMLNCYQCWVKNVRSMWALRDHIQVYQSANDVIRDSYFYQSQAHMSVSYGIEPVESSAVLVENNIFQQVTSPFVFNQGSGWVLSYNFNVDNVSKNYMQGSYVSHNAGSGMNLWEGNNTDALDCDDTWGTSTLLTFFRNQMTGWEAGYSQQTIPFIANSYCRGLNVVGNVIGQPNFHNQYQSYATSPSGGVGASACNTSIYDLAWSDTGGLCVASTPPPADPIAYTTLLRWGNWDTVSASAQWNSSEIPTTAVPYINANPIPPSNHTLPPSFYYASKPSWWVGATWPPIGPDVFSGNLGVCTGTYAGAMATGSGSCTGGSLASAWSGHANAIPAQNCYLNTLNGPADGSGGVLNFDANTCYGSQGGGSPPPQNLNDVVH